jgi:phosphatidylserine/phosphatidylglycerophosphate/cardiolipin synthase-like enzyme
MTMGISGTIETASREPPLLRSPETCAFIAPAERAAVLIDTAQYFGAAKAVMRAARRSIFLLGWDFDPRTLLEPEATPLRDDHVLGLFLNQLKAARPALDIRILIWSMSLPIAAQHGFFPHRSRFWLDRGIKFHLDRSAPYGASRHEKLLVVDDAIAFCGGSDFARDRLDTRSHTDRARWRRLPNGERYPPRHDVMICVEGQIARALGTHARARWQEATGETPAAPAQPQDQDSLWPAELASPFNAVPVGVVRSVPADRGKPGVRQTAALSLTAIAAAQRLIYLENQYFTAAPIREALARRLMEPDGPEIVLICTDRSPSYFDRATMDSTRDVFIARLRACDRFDRLRVYAPHTSQGRPIIVHSKMAIIDDRLLRIGSSNLNNRSCGYDTETDLAIEAEPADMLAAGQIAVIRATLLGHFIGWTGAQFDAHRRRHESMIAALDALGEDGRRLRPYEPRPLGFVSRVIAAWHLGDPTDIRDAWRAWRRPKDAVSAISTISGR